MGHEEQFSLNHPDVRKVLGLPDKDAPLATANSGEIGTPGVPGAEPSTKQHNVSIQNLSAQELLALSVQLLAKGHQDRAIPLLRLALDKDPDYVRALVVMGQTLLQKGLSAEATEYLKQAVSKHIEACQGLLGPKREVQGKEKYGFH
ncbi:unnamed protein product [Ilex paraguariensis]|uniref:Tetratricopeptide repeat protein n=1 Tax=Ilex paraguariensis TaxID=185542 RepID=A0ABC8SHJ0_9AQUA